MALKTKVGRSAGADPKPAQRKVNTRLPSGATFDDRVQAMAFRGESGANYLGNLAGNLGKLGVRP